MSEGSLDQSSAYMSGGSSDSSFSMSRALEGYDFEFVPPVQQRYECPICLLILREPRQTKCGHRFCRDCILRALRSSCSRCPVDNESLTESDLFPDNFAKREILNCNVKCPNSKHGCEKLVALGKLQNHLSECPYTLIPCPNRCPCILPRQDLEDHMTQHCELRNVACTQCQQIVQANQMKDHDIICPKALIICQFCKETMQREKMTNHLERDCQKMTVYCPLYLLGCRTTMLRCDENAHLSEDAPSHLRHLYHAVLSLQAELHKSPHNPTHSHPQSLSSSLSSHHWVDMRSLGEAVADIAKLSHEEGGISSSSNLTSTPMAAHTNFGHKQTEEGFSWDSYLHTSSVGHKSTEHDSSCTGNVVDSAHLQALAFDSSSVSSRNLLDLSINQANRSLSVNSLPAMAHSSSPQSSPSREFALAGSLPRQKKSSLQSMPPSSSQFYSSQHSQITNLATMGTEHSQMFSCSPVSQNSVSMQGLATQMEQRFECQQQKIEELSEKLAATEKTNSELESRVTYLESQLLEREGQICMGDYYWRVTQFSQHEQKALAGETAMLHSPPFWTSPFGYKICMRANITSPADSPGQSSRLSLFIHFMQGTHDNLLTWPFAGKIVLTVLDQNPNQHVRMPITETLEAKPHLAAFQKPNSTRNPKGFGFTDFVALSVLTSQSYLLDDTLIIRAQVFPEKH